MVRSNCGGASRRTDVARRAALFASIQYYHDLVVAVGVVVEGTERSTAVGSPVGMLEVHQRAAWEHLVLVAAGPGGS